MKITKNEMNWNAIRGMRNHVVLNMTSWILKRYLILKRRYTNIRRLYRQEY